MLILLPPSETKRAGGADGSKLDYARLRYPQLNTLRRRTVRAARELAADRNATITALKLGPRQYGEIAHNRSLTRSATMPAIDRYTGVLFDALDAQSLPQHARDFLGHHVVIHSAILGPVGALDPIPAYRLSHDSRLPEIRLKHLWAAPVAAILNQERGLILDARSEAYAGLGPAPAGSLSAFLRVVTTQQDGRRRALNHFNKRAKGEFVRALALARREIDSIDSLVHTAGELGFQLNRGTGVGPGGVAELELVI
jgi:cytoplasmic iron level regulating protein YaaA (DUF328/UPF0246 family)